MTVDLSLKLFDHNREKDQFFDFGSLGVDEAIALDLKEAFLEITGHYSGRSRYQAWKCLKYFCLFLVAEKINSLSGRKDILYAYGKWLERNSCLKKTNGTYFVIARRLVLFMAEVSLLSLWRGQSTIRFNFAREQYSVRDNEISVELLKKITQACKKEIEDITSDLAVKEFWLNHGVLPVLGLSEVQKIVLQELFTLETQGVWTQRQMAEIKRTSLGSAGLSMYLKYRELTLSTILPFYLLILIETGANPISLMEIKLDCIEHHPNDDAMVFLSWEKRRSSKEQSLPMLKKGKYSVKTLVDLISRATSHLRGMTDPADSMMLFVTRNGSRVKRLSSQGLHNALHKFREEHDFPYFTFSDIRKAIACLIDVNSTSIKTVSRFLNHKNSDTTKMYLKGKAHVRSKYNRVAEYQGLMIDAVSAYKSEVQSDTYETVFGISCVDPLNSPVPSSIKGMPCVEFLSCATCPNAMIVKDSITNVARIIKAKLSLEEFELQVVMDADMKLRFDELYAPVLKIIREEILPNIPKKTLTAAEKIIDTITALPRLV